MRIIVSLVFVFFISAVFAQSRINLTAGERGFEGGLEFPMNKKENEIKNYLGFRFGVTELELIDENDIKLRYGFNSAITYKYKLWKWRLEYPGITGLKEREVIQFFTGSSVGVRYNQNSFYNFNNGWKPYVTLDLNFNLLLLDFQKFDLRCMLEVNYGLDYNPDSSKKIQFLDMVQVGFQFIINKEKKKLN